MSDMQLSFPEFVYVPQTLTPNDGQFVELFRIDGEEITMFCDSHGQLMVGGAPIGYQKLEKTPGDRDELNDLIHRLLLKLVTNRGPYHRTKS